MVADKAAAEQAAAVLEEEERLAEEKEKKEAAAMKKKEEEDAEAQAKLPEDDKKKCCLQIGFKEGYKADKCRSSTLELLTAVVLRAGYSCITPPPIHLPFIMLTNVHHSRFVQ